MFEYKVLIREQHLDSYGHVNNATYLTLFEEARWELSTQKGYGYKAIHEAGKGPVILEINMKFLKEVTLRETVTIQVTGSETKGIITKLKQLMLKENGEVGCELNLVFGFFDFKTRKLIPPSPEWKRVLEG